MPDKTDLELVEEIRNGNTNSEQELIHRYQFQIIRKVRLSLQNQSKDWEDIVQEIYVSIIISLRDGKYDPSKEVPLGSYIYGIVKHKIQDYIRNVKRQKISMYHEFEETYYPSSSIEDDELKRILTILLKKLKPKYRQVLYLRYFKEQSIDEISKEIKIPKTSVSERIYYALKLLRKECEKENIFPYF